MTSILKVDTIQDQAGNNIINESSDTITIGASGDTITIPSGATLDVTSATVSGISSYTNSDALTLFNASGSAPVYACRAWVNFNGEGVVAIREDGNVTSITDVATGRYTVNFTTAMTDANYCTQVSINQGSASVLRAGSFETSETYSTSAVSIICENGSGTDSDRNTVCVAIFR